MSNKAAAIRTAIKSAIGKMMLVTKDLDAADKIKVDLEGGDIEINSRYGFKINSTATVETNDIKTYEGAIHLVNGGTVKIKDINLEALNSGAVNYLNGIVIENCNKVILDNVKVTGAPFSGIRVINCEVLSALECNASHNLYAGLIVQNCKHITILGGEYSYNGLHLPSTGYGINIAHRSGLEIDNEAITILSVKAYYNKRKGLDVHGGVGGCIMGCHVKGFGNGGIYALSEAGSDPDDPSIVDNSWLKHVKDWIIADNTVENDLTWYNAECAAAGVNNFSFGADACPIFVGSYGNGVNLSAGSFIVHDNLIRNCNVAYSRGHIFVFTNFDGVYAPDSIKIHDNIIMDAGVAFSDSSGYDGVIHVTGVNHPKIVDIHNNNIDGIIQKGVKVNVGTVVSVHDNNFSGTITDAIDINYDLLQKTNNNIYNGKPLPNMLSKDNGSVEYQFTTSASNTYLDTIKVDANSYEDGYIACDIKFIAIHKTLSASFEGNATAGNNSGVIMSAAKITRRSPIIGTAPGDIEPGLSWVSSGDDRILRFSLPQTYSGYFIRINIAGWRLHVKGA